MLKKIIFYCLLLIGLGRCEAKIPTTSQLEDAEQLSIKRSTIVSLAESATCTNASEWSYSPLGSKPCGGPWSYIAYSDNINTLYFTNLIEQYKLAETAYNEKWSVLSDCSMAAEPSGLECQNGIAVLIY